MACYTGQPQRSAPPRKLLSYVEDKKLRFEPGSKYYYSNTDNAVVGLMVERATGRAYESQLREHDYRPLDLKKTTLPAGPNLRAPYIHGHRIVSKPQTKENSDFV